MAPRLRYTEIAPEGVAHMRALEHYLNATIALPAVLLELVRLRVSLRNGCHFCTGHHTAELRKHHEPDSRIDALSDWASSDAFTPRERAALAWADALTGVAQQPPSEEAYESAAVFFDDKDLVDLTLAIASINAWNRLSLGFGERWDPRGSHTRASQDQPQNSAAFSNAADTLPPPVQDVVDDDGGKVAQS